MASPGDQFLISLDNNPFETFFLDEFGQEITLNPSSFSSGGTISVAAAAVPEPGILPVLVILAAAMMRERFRFRSRIGQA